jgi:hypothetical protein
MASERVAVPTQPPLVDDTDVLRCPICGGDYLHHEALDWYERAVEDAARGVRVRIGGQAVAVDADAPQLRSPSARRHGFVVDFTCETCGALDLVLALVQHKGMTLLEWRPRRVLRHE